MSYTVLFTLCEDEIFFVYVGAQVAVILELIEFIFFSLST